LSTIIGICAAVVDRLEALAGSPPPAGWSPPPVPASIGWAALSGADQQLLTSVRQGAQALCPGATVILFGSRATGLARPDSDYDLLVILPEDIDPYVRALIMSNVRDMVRETGAAVDHEYVTVNTWQNPPPGARILVEQREEPGNRSARRLRR
jgi:predicted nucleotidyltransferase